MAKKATVHSVENKINLNVNQNDLVEMVVSEQLEFLEKRLLELYDAYEKSSWEKLEQLKKKLQVPTELEDAMSVLYTKTELSKIIYELDVEFATEKSESFSIPTRDAIEDRNIGRNYFHASASLYKQATRLTCVAGKRDDVRNPYHAQNIVRVTFPAHYIDNGLVIEMLDVKNKAYHALVELNHVLQLYRKTRRSAPSAKAKLIRKALSGSEEGQAVLNIIDNSGIKLLV